MNRNPFGFQSQVFNGIVRDIERAQPVVVKLIDPDSDTCREIKRVSPNTTTIVRIYTGQPEVDDAAQHPSAYEYGRQYADTVYHRVPDPAHADYIEAENEPNDHYGNLTQFIERLNDFTLGFCDRAKQLGFKPCILNFSTGYPEIYLEGGFTLWVNAWQGLRECLDAAHALGGVLGLHEYDAPDLLRLWSDSAQRGYLVGRHKAVYAALDNHPIPLYLTEFGIDWLVHGIAGGFWHNQDENAPLWYMEQLRQAYHKVLATTPQLRGVCTYLHSGYHPLWEEYDSARTETSREIFVRFMQEDLGWGLPQLPPLPGDTMITPAQIRAPLPATIAKAMEWDLGQHLYGEWEAKDDTGKSYFPNLFDKGGVLAYTENGVWQLKYFDRKTFVVSDAPPVTTTPPPPPVNGGSLPQFVFPDILRMAGFVGSEGIPLVGKVFYRLSPTAAVALGVSAFCEVVVIGANRVPQPGAQVISRRADGKGEIVVTGGDGKARFNFGAGSAFTPPTMPPFEIFIAEGAVKDEDSKIVSWRARLSDAVFVGDTRGEHTEIYLQYVGYQT